MKKYKIAVAGTGYVGLSNAMLFSSGIDIHFVQDNQSMSTKGVLRGIHF